MTRIIQKPEDLQAAALADVFKTLKDDAADDPLLNPVRRLASEVFRTLEGGAVSLDALDDVVATMSAGAFEDRARRFHERRSHGAPVRDILNDAADKGFDAYRSLTERACAGVVFTAHPTFALGEAKRKLIARYPVSGDDAACAAWRQELEGLDRTTPPITLRYEHAEARKAIVNAQEALRALNAEILKIARDRFPDQWKSLQPQPASVATWVGYDLDGRTDIHWGETVRIRLEEKAAQLRRYEELLTAILANRTDGALGALLQTLSQAAAFAEKQRDAFAGDLNDPEVVVGAANLITARGAGRLTSLKAAIETLSECIEQNDDDLLGEQLILLRAEMQACGLGLARIHLRVNAAQVRSALRADLGLEPDGGFKGRSALDIAAQKATSAEERAVNFGSVFLEKMTARRQFMLCAQILKHIDADTPIRFLIAECEAPATVMGAVYLARLYGVADKLDISPLFETPSALESGGRFIERLLQEEEFRRYVARRGRMAIQLGFSDSGRFMGQSAAALAVERLQVLFARALKAAELPGVEALIFNTHGESMGRGAHPVSFSDRLSHIATPWVRSLFAKEGIALNTECSFQGGEGYLHFQTPMLSADTLNAVWANGAAAASADMDDRFYKDINFSWDFYRRLKAWQEALFARDDYRRILSSFPQNFLFKTGSRQTKRAKRGDGGPDLSALRAIPHNAILQQLAAPANVAGGVGDAAGQESERLIDHIAGSPRMRELIAYAHYARSLTNMSALRGYAEIYAPSYWTSLALNADPGPAEAYEAVQHALGSGEIASSIDQLTNYLLRDLRRFDVICASLSDESVKPHAPGCDRLAMLHAIRQALIARAISLTARAPAFSRRHDVDRSDLIRLTVELQIEEVIDLLKRIFPKQSDGGGVFSGLEERIEEGDPQGGAYPDLHHSIIDPLERINGLLRRLSAVIADHYGAFG